jgi:DNA polymerase III alpha subunit
MKQLRIHTEYSLKERRSQKDEEESDKQKKDLTCEGKLSDVFNMLYNNGQEKFIITDYGNTYYIAKAQAKIKTWNDEEAENAKKENREPKAKVSFIPGVDLEVRADVKDRWVKREQVTYIARNEVGYKTMCKLVGIFTQTKYYTNYLPIDSLLPANTNNILIVTSDTLFDKYKGDEHVYFGLGPKTYKPDLIKAKEYGFKIVAINDNNYLGKDDEFAYRMLNADNFDSTCYPSYVMNEEEYLNYMKDIFDIDDLKQAIKNGEELYETLEPFKLPVSEFPIVNKEKDIKEKALEELKKRNLDKPEYLARLDRELKVIEAQGYIDYFYMVDDLLTWCRNNGIFTGFGRGSGAGSLLCYLLHITECDPLKYNLLFERFLDINVAAMPDLDLDIDKNKRKEAYEYLKKTYGDDNVKAICNAQYGKLGVANIFQKYIPMESEDFSKLKSILETYFEENNREKSFEKLQQNEEFTELLNKYEGWNEIYKLFFHVMSFGKHACGLAITKQPLEDLIGVDYIKDCIMMDGDGTNANHILKLDLLGLANLSIFDECLKRINKDRDWLLSIDFEIQEVFDVINNKSNGIFQFEGDTMKDCIDKVKIESFEDVAALIAVVRPGPLKAGVVDQFAAFGEVSTIPEVAKIFEPTRNVCVYQEQVMKIAKEVGDMSWETVSKLRKFMGKVLGGNRDTWEDKPKAWWMDWYKAEFLKGALAKYPEKEEELAKIWDMCLGGAGYQFNKSHAVAYAMITYMCAYLIKYYPAEYHVSLLSYSTNEEYIIKTLQELINSEQEICLFDKNNSEATWSIKDGCIYGGYDSLKGVKTTAEEVCKKVKTNAKLTPALKAKIETGESRYQFLETLYLKSSDLRQCTEDGSTCIIYVQDYDVWRNKKEQEYQSLVVFDKFNKHKVILAANKYSQYNKLEKKKFYLVTVTTYYDKLYINQFKQI